MELTKNKLMTNYEAGVDTHFIIGLDLGQSNDYSALLILQRHQEWEKGQVPAKPNNLVLHAKDWVEQKQTEEPDYQIRHIHRYPLGTPYPDVIEHVKGLVGTPEIKGKYALVIDHTGVGRPVFDIAVKEGLTALGMTITGGDSVTGNGKNQVRVAKRLLVSTVQAVMQTNRLKMAEGLQYGDTLQKELLDFRVKITDSANDIYSAREGAHDDLVLSLAMALYVGEQFIRPQKVAKQFTYAR